MDTNLKPHFWEKTNKTIDKTGITFLFLLYLSVQIKENVCFYSYVHFIYIDGGLSYTVYYHCNVKQCVTVTSVVKSDAKFNTGTLLYSLFVFFQRIKMLPLKERNQRNCKMEEEENAEQANSIVYSNKAQLV